jgi:poly-beta-1,6-N-acetyl-D-glucosamine N-deacetylase
MVRSRSILWSVATLFAVLLAALPGRAMAQGPERSIEMPILVYHKIDPAPLPATATPMDRLMTVTPDELEQQLKYLKDGGYHAVSFDALADFLEHGKPLPERPAILSFDDGWGSQFTYALPLLQKYGFPATFFIVTNFVDMQNFLSTAQLKALLAAGMTVGSHTRSHAALPSIADQAKLADEIVGSKAWLEAQLGVKIDTFAYPFGAYTPAIAAMVKAAGYRTARTANGGAHYTPDDLETLSAVLFPDYIARFRDKVELAAGEVRH